MVTPEEKQRLNNFALKLLDLIAQEQDRRGLFGAALGFAVGGMIGEGATEQDVRDIFEASLSQIVAAASAYRNQQVS